MSSGVNVCGKNFIKLSQKLLPKQHKRCIIITLTYIEYKTIEPPEDGWTSELLNEVLYINGYNVGIPFTLKDIGWDKELIDVSYSEDLMNFSGYLIKDDSISAVVSGFTNDEGIYDENSQIYFIIVDIHDFTNYKDDNKNRNLINLNGIRLGDKIDEDIMLNTFGKKSADITTEQTFGYYINKSDTDYIYINSKDNKIRTIYILLRMVK